MADSYVCSGAKIRCTMGTGVATLTVLPTPIRTVMLTGKPQANISDTKPIANVGSCGNCCSLLYEPTAVATAEASGVLTPMPCVPSIVGPWFPGKLDYLLQGSPALLKSDHCQCAFGGIISFVNDGQKPTGPVDLYRKEREPLQLKKAKKEEDKEEVPVDEEANNLLKKAGKLFTKVEDSGKKLRDDALKLKDAALDELADTIYKFGGDKIVGVMDDIAKGKYFGTEQWKYLLDQSYNLMENGYVEGNALKKNAGSFLYLVCSTWQEDTWIDTFETVRAGDNIIDIINNPKDLTETVDKINKKIKSLKIDSNTIRVLNNTYNSYNIASEGNTLVGKIKKRDD